jgi:two-component system, chemotaxis family, protein-glutamate methylesterase/glutaminase
VHDNRQPFDVICVGASAGGVLALAKLTASLPADLDAAVLVLMLMTHDSRDALPAILRRGSALPVAEAADRAPLVHGQIRIAPPGYRLRVTAQGTLVDAAGSPASRRPSIDELFESAALAFGSRVLGVILSGELHDGASGMDAIRRAGGVTVVQAPESAFATSMPLAVIRAGDADHVATIDELGALIGRLAQPRLALSGEVAR